MKTFEERLETESSAWLGEGLVTAEQRARLLARHPRRAGSGHRFLAIMAAVGGALLAVGVSLVIKSNWEQIGDWVKIGGLVALLLGAYAAGWKLKIAPGLYPRTGDACFMLGAVSFLLGIALVTQIFHLNRRPPNGVLLWWLGIVALPWAVRGRGLQFVSVVAWFTWVAMELMADDSWLRLIDTTGFWEGSEFPLFAAATFLLGLALLFFGLGLRDTRHEDFAGLHEKLGLVVASWALFVLGLSWSTQNGYYWHVRAARSEPLIVLSGLASIAAVFAGWRNRDGIKSLAWYLAPGLVPVFAILLGIDLHDSHWLWGGLACLAMFVLNLGMIRVGLATGREGWINLGMAGIAANVIARYFLLFGTMLEGGVFFIVTGTLVLALGYYLEHKRRKLVQAVRKEVLP